MKKNSNKLFLFVNPWKMSSMDYVKHTKLYQDLAITGTWSGKTWVTSYEFRVTSYELRVESLKARVEIQKCEFKSTSYEFKSMSYEFESTSHEFKSTSYEFDSKSYEFESTRTIKSMKTQVSNIESS